MFKLTHSMIVFFLTSITFSTLSVGSAGASEEPTANMTVTSRPSIQQEENPDASNAASRESLAVHLGDIDCRKKSKTTLSIIAISVVTFVIFAGVAGWRIYASITCNKDKKICEEDCKSTYASSLYLLEACHNNCSSIAQQCIQNFALKYRYTNSSSTP